MKTQKLLMSQLLPSCALVLALLLTSQDLQAQSAGKFPSYVETLLRKQSAIAKPVGPRPAPIPDPARSQWKPDQPAREWKYIVLHHSATSQGSVASIHHSHSQRLDAQGNPWRGIAYHFVIGNGQGMSDGTIESTFRWDDQLEGAHAGDAEYNSQGIGICLIGNFDEQEPTQAQQQACRQLIDHLTKKYNIPHSRVVGHSDVKATQCPGKYFPKISTVLVPPADRKPAITNRVTLKNEDAPLPVLK